MYNPDYPSTTYGWNAFTYHAPYDQQQQSIYYNGQGVANPFASAANNVPTGSRRQIGQEFANNWSGNNQQANYGYGNPTPGVGFASSPYAPAQQNNGIATPPQFNQPSLLSANAFQQQGQYGTSPAPQFDCLYNGTGIAWDKSNSKTPAWDNYYTQERKPMPPYIDWKAQDRQEQNQQNGCGYGYGYNPGNINPNSVKPQFAQPNDDWLANAKSNFSL